jgi:hypothetical protein
MASPGELVRAVAEVLGVPEATVSVHDRNLVMAGLRTKGGRGTSAAKMTPRDAAHLLVAVMGSAQVKDSVKAVQRYSETMPHDPTSGSHDYSKVLIPGLAELPENHSFVDALTAILAAAAEGKVISGLARDFIFNSMSISVLTPGTRSEIRISGPRRDTSAHVQYFHSYTRRRMPEDDTERKKWWEEEDALRKERAESQEDLEQYRRISAKTILSLGNTLRPE